MAEVTRVILLRHGETEWNAAGKFQGHLNSELTARGIAQAQAMAQRLKSVKFAALYASDLKRAEHTAEIIGGATGYKVRTDARLRERALGIFQGLDKAAIAKEHPETWKQYTSGGADYAVPEGESIAGRFRINLEALEEIARAHLNENVVVVSHGGLVSAMFRYVVGLPLDSKRRFSLINASYNSFLYENPGWLLETWGDTGHVAC